MQVSKEVGIDMSIRTCNGSATIFSGGTTRRAWDEIIRGSVRASSAYILSMNAHSKGDYRTSLLGDGLELLAPGIRRDKEVDNVCECEDQFVLYTGLDIWFFCRQFWEYVLEP